MEGIFLCPGVVPALSQYIYIFTGTNKVFAFIDLSRFFSLSRCPGEFLPVWQFVAMFPTLTTSATSNSISSAVGFFERCLTVAGIVPRMALIFWSLLARYHLQQRGRRQLATDTTIADTEAC